MRRALAAIACLLAGCGGPGPPRPAAGRCDAGDAGAACVELGVGAGAEIADGTIPLVHGPQGGWHVEVGLRMSAGAPVPEVVEYEVREEGRVLGAVRYAIEPRLLETDADGDVLRVGDIVILDVEDGSTLIGSSVEVVVELDGEEADRRLLVVRPR